MNNLENNGKLTLGESLVSVNGKYTLILQSHDGNLVLYEGKKVLWNAITENKDAQEAKMQTDGNFVIYNSKNEPIFASNTQGNTGAFLLLTDEGTITIISHDKSLWTRPE